jgi:hypothetical protein
VAVDWDQLVVAPNFAIFGEEESAFYTPQGGSGFSIAGVFDPPYHEVRLLDDEPSVTTQPVLGVRLVQFPTPPSQGDQVRIASVATTFTVKEVKPDGHGWALLVLMGPTAGT